jgi:TctA family transporter
MQALQNLSYGFETALSPFNLGFCLIGALLGTVVGVLPGIGPVTAIALLLPITFKISATSAIIMLAGIYYGANHAASTTAIMLNMPGEPAAIVICFDGHPMAKQGRAGPALCMAALASFFAGCIAILIITLFSPPLADAALRFQGPEYTAAVLLALVGVSALSRRNILRTLSMAVLGLALGTIGTDVSTGTTRFTFDEPRLSEGVSFIPVAMGLFAFVDICFALGSPEKKASIQTRVRDLLPTWADIRRCISPVIRGTALGGAFGILPGTGPLISSFAAYALEKKLSRHPERFGEGAIEGVAAPEAAANAAAFTHFIPMLTLGIPAGATMALMLGALMIQGIPPGPQIMTGHPDLFWGLIASMWIGNLMLLVLNLPLVGVWIKLLQTPYRLLYPAIVLFCLIGIYSERYETFDIMLCAVVVFVGFWLQKLDCEPGPLIVGLVLGPVLEENLRRALIVSRGNPSVFLTRPISLSLLILAALILAVFTLPALRRKEERVKGSAAGIE